MDDGPCAVVCLVGAEHEENLSLRYLASAVEAAGFDARIVESSGDAQESVRHVLVAQPLVVGLSVPFQQHAPASLGLTDILRQSGFGGHVCVGGHFATFEHEAILRHFPGVDSVVRHEGEDTFVELCRAVRDGRRLAELGVPGLVVRDGDRFVVGPRRPLPELDSLRFPDRRGAPHDVMGVACSPLLGSRGQTNLGGLESITSVGGDLNIDGNSSLTSLGGLESITSVGGDLGITSNTSLTNLEGLESITSVGRDLGIYGNNSMTSLDGLGALTSVRAELRIGSNDSLESLGGLEGLQTVGGNVLIGCYLFDHVACTAGSPSLSTLDGLESLTSAGDHVVVGGSPLLPTCEAEALEARLEAHGWSGEYWYQDTDDDATCD